MPCWSFSAVEAAEPEESAEEEKRVESKSDERKREKIGSDEKVSRGEKEAGEGGGGVAAAVAEEVEGVEGFLKVESLWSGEEEGREDL